MTQRQGRVSVEGMCRLAGVSRAGFYWHWQGRSPAAEETDLRDAIQRLALAHRHYGYRRITALLRREGRLANHKRVLRLMREDTLLCLRRAAFVPATTDSRHDFPVWPNVARRLTLSGPNQLWVADITYGAPRPGWSGVRVSGMLKRKEELNERLALCCERA